MAEVTQYFATWPWQHWAEERPSAVALSFGAQCVDGECIGEQRFSWAEMSHRVDEYAQGLIEQGVKRDQMIAIVAPNSIQVIWLILATLRIGARYVGLNPKNTEIELNEQLARLNNDYIWYPARTVHQFTTGKRLHLLQPEQPRIVPVTWQQTRPATLTLTSGSTGIPKAAVHTAENHLASAEGLLEMMDFGSDDSWLLSLPLFHISGLAIFWRWLYRGAKLVVTEPACFEHSLTMVTHASLVPTQLQRLLASKQGEGNDTLRLKQVLLGGAAIPVSLTDAAERIGISCWCGYGMTEMGSTVTAKKADASGGVGTVLGNRDFMIKDSEVYVQGATLCLGYYRNKMIFPACDGEWFATRDLGEWRGNELHILGRADNMFISGGENIQPEDVEKVLMTHTSVRQAFVLPMDDAEFGQRPIAIVDTDSVLSNDVIASLESHMTDNIVSFKRPIRYLALPKELATSGIKVSRKQLSEWLAQQL